MNRQSGGNGDTQSFESLCAALRPDLMRFAFWLCRDRQLAEDVVQEALLRAWKSRDALADRSALKPWLLTIVRREFARTFERKRLETVDVQELVSREESVLATGESEDILELRRAIMRLEDEYREPLLLQVVMGFTTAEIATELGLTTAAVLTRLFRARHKLRAMYGEDTSLDPE